MAATRIIPMHIQKGNHAFTVSTHIDRAHIHNHIIFNSTTLDCTRKFRNFWWSTLAVQRLSDTICLEHKLSVIRQKPYNKRARRTSYPVRHTKRAHIRAVLDEILQEQPKDIKEIVRAFRELGLPAATKTDAGVHRCPQKCRDDPGD